MSLALVFNHDSLPYDDPNHVNSAILDFVKVSLACRKYGFNLMLVDIAVDKSWFGIELAKGVYWRDWFNSAKQKSEMKELVSAFRSLNTRQPLMLPDDEMETKDSIEVGLKGKDQGLKILQTAYWHETFLISFPTREPWHNTLIDVWILNVEINGDSNECIDQIKNLFDTNSLQQHENHLRIGCQKVEKYFVKTM